MAQFQLLTHCSVAFVPPGFASVIRENLKLASEIETARFRFILAYMVLNIADHSLQRINIGEHEEAYDDETIKIRRYLADYSARENRRD